MQWIPGKDMSTSRHFLLIMKIECLKMYSEEQKWFQAVCWTLIPYLTDTNDVISGVENDYFNV